MLKFKDIKINNPFKQFTNGITFVKINRKTARWLNSNGKRILDIQLDENQVVYPSS